MFINSSLLTGEPYEYLHEGGKLTPSELYFHTILVGHVEKDVIIFSAYTQHMIFAFSLGGEKGQRGKKQQKKRT